MKKRTVSIFVSSFRSTRTKTLPDNSSPLISRLFVRFEFDVTCRSILLVGVGEGDGEGDGDGDGDPLGPAVPIILISVRFVKPESSPVIRTWRASISFTL